MTQPTRGFGSDNHSGVHPQILDAIVMANTNHAPSYGTDPLSAQAKAALKKHFGDRADIFWVFTGTAANVLAINALTQSHHAVLCADISHLNMDECGAPERWTGCKLLTCPTTHGKLQVQDLEKHLIRRGDQHYAQPRVLSITQPTEVGTVYSLSELRTLADFAHRNDLLFHIDGARLSNACITLDCTLGEMTTEVGADAVSFGGTKNGFLLGEAVVFPQGDPTGHFRFLRKQALQLPSKTRFLAAQFLAFMQNDLWRDIATHSNSMATLLAEGLREFPEIRVTHPVQSNGVFAQIPKHWVKRARERYFFYVWDPAITEVRLMCSFDTTTEDIAGLLGAFRDLQVSESSPTLEPESRPG
ncbi:MAG: low specificity L-threonine aldolase [Myxococcota bacterium]|nr:low specificity L-threonine aldolase [Myxococcota bacterium]